MIKVSEKLSHLEHVPLDSLVYFQEDFKALTQKNYNKLKRSLLEEGIFVPMFVWAHDGQMFILDGHQRFRVMEKEGWNLDVPIVQVEATDKQDAKKKVLLISSQFGTVDQESWDAFTWDMPDASEWAQFDALPFVFNQYNFGPGDDPNEHWQGMPEYENEGIEPFQTIKVHFENIESVMEFAELIGQRLTEKSIWVWYPEKKPENLMQYRAIDES